MSNSLSLNNLSPLNLDELQSQYDDIKQQGLSLDITRGKPSAEQLALSNPVHNILNDGELNANTDLRNYGCLEGIAPARKLGAEILGLQAEQVVAGGNSSLTLMYQSVLFAYLFGTPDPDTNGSDTTKKTSWHEQAREASKPVSFICPVPGYDRHFSICQELGINMLTVPMTSAGPDMDAVEALIKNDLSIRGLWCVPKYSNPTGCIYSNNTVERIAKLGLNAHPSFRVFWDNAYAVHDLHDKPSVLANIMDACKQHGTENSILQFASTSKVTFAGAGMAWLGASETNLKWFTQHLGMSTIGADKVNQARHVKFLPNLKAVQVHMTKHAALLKPRFDCVLNTLETGLGEAENNPYGRWEAPQGGYFVSFDAQPGLATEIIQLAKDAGVKLTPAGATFPYKKDPDDKNIRLAPSFPTLAELEQAMAVFVLCVKIATAKHLST